MRLYLGLDVIKQWVIKLGGDLRLEDTRLLFDRNV